MLIAGVDEVGRGTLVGNVVSAAVILDPKKPINGLKDSKKLSEKRRNELCILIRKNALCICVSFATAVEIDELNILNATLLSMKRAVLGLKVTPTLVLIDGNKAPVLDIQTKTIIKGDEKIEQIKAASIVAKVFRDQQMIELDKKYPKYGFAKHKGYATKDHKKNIQQFSIIKEHRKSFAPIKNII